MTWNDMANATYVRALEKCLLAAMEMLNAKDAVVLASRETPSYGLKKRGRPPGKKKWKSGRFKAEKGDEGEEKI